MSILDTIIAHKRKEVTARKEQTSVSELEKAAFFNTKQPSFKDALLQVGSSGIIAEFKKKSPSKGIINGNASVTAITKGYQKAGAAAVSVLTDAHFFGGNDKDLIAARTENPTLPILRKEFLIDEYQLLEAKALGASAILLIAAVLTKQETENLASFAHSLGLEVLMEIHTEKELGLINPHLDLVGVNNRNLNTFEVSIQNSIRLFPLIPKEFIKISESGISDVVTVLELQKVGFQGFLMGENFMKTENPAKACESFIKQMSSNS